MSAHDDQSQPWSGLPVAGPLLRPRQAAGYLSISLGTFYAEIAKGRLPPLVKVASRAAGVPQAWIDATLAARAAESAKEN
jgi:predicted DNA-binding transcriptional regulator AlpA